MCVYKAADRHTDRQNVRMESVKCYRGNDCSCCGCCGCCGCSNHISCETSILMRSLHVSDWPPNHKQPIKNYSMLASHWLVMSSSLLSSNLIGQFCRHRYHPRTSLVSSVVTVIMLEPHWSVLSSSLSQPKV